MRPRTAPLRFSALGLAGIGVLAVGVLGVVVGHHALAPGEVIAALFGRDVPAAVIVLESRLPRTIAALACGALLGLAGGAMRTLTLNPIADPGLLGVSAGGALGVAALTLLGVSGIGAARVAAAVLGAAAATLLLALISLSRIGRDATTVTVVGFCVAVAAGAIVNVVSLVDATGMAELQAWRSGSLELLDPEVLRWAALPAVLGVAILILTARSAALLELGPDLATALGSSPPRTRAALLLAICGLAGSAVAVAGPISFVGLVAVHLAARSGVTGRHSRALLVAAIGAIALAGADILGRLLPGTGEVPAGITFGCIGGAALIAILISRRGIGASSRSAGR